LILRHLFSPPNNTRLSHLCGPMDEHLRTIEVALQIKIAHRHEQFKVDGTKANAKRGMEMLQALYEIAARPIAPATVQLMLAGDPEMDSAEGPALKTKRADLKPRTLNQANYLDHIASHDITFGIGPAGTGKTYLAVAMAVDALQRSAVQRIVLTRPAVEAGERLGYLPGDLAQKIDPYLRPLYDALYDLMGFEQVQKAFERQTIEIAPLAFMRGRTLNTAFVILDEAQNTTPEQMKMFLTRIGFGSKAVVTGDVSQIDLPKTQLSGLIDAERVLKQIDGIAICRLTSSDVVRHPLVARIVDAYDAELTLSLQFSSVTKPDKHRAALPRHRVKKWIRHALQTDGEITVRIVDAEEGQTLNREYRKKDYATNVLTFRLRTGTHRQCRPGAVRTGGSPGSPGSEENPASPLRASDRARRVTRPGLGP
jgi:phosphate starvation-inducible PhoH-like protein